MEYKEVNDLIRKHARVVGAKHGKTAELDYGAGAEWMYEILSKELATTKKELAVYKAGFLDLKIMINNCHETESPCDCCEASSECECGQLDCIDMLEKHFLKGE